MNAKEAREELLADDNVIAEVEDFVRQAGYDLLEAAAEDVRKFAEGITRQMLVAVAAREPELIASAKRQAVLLAELQRIRVNNAAWDTFYTVVERGVDVALRVATTALLNGAMRLDSDD